MSGIDQKGAQYSFNTAGSNTPVQVVFGPARLYHISVSQTGGSMGYLQVYNLGTLATPNGTLVAGTATQIAWTVEVPAGTLGAGTPSFRDVVYGPYGREMSGGISYLWSAGATGTVAHGVNAVVNITYQGTY